MKQMVIEFTTGKNPGVSTQYGNVGIECCQEEQTFGGIAYLASGGCAVAECCRCEEPWKFVKPPTHGIGPLLRATDNPNAFDRVLGDISRHVWEPTTGGRVRSLPHLPQRDAEDTLHAVAHRAVRRRQLPS